MVSAEDAHRIGLVNRIYEPAELLPAAEALAKKIIANAPLAVRYSKSVMKRAAEMPESEGWAINQEAVDVVFNSADAMEGPLAFAEKREPRWQGK